MSEASRAALPAKFKRLAWSLAAQSAEQIGLAATPMVAVLALGAQEDGTGALHTAETLPFLLASIFRPASWSTGCRDSATGSRRGASPSPG